MTTMKQDQDVIIMMMKITTKTIQYLPTPQYLQSPYDVAGPVLNRTVHVSTHLTFKTTTPGGRFYYYVYFTGALSSFSKAQLVSMECLEKKASDPVTDPFLEKERTLISEAD